MHYNVVCLYTTDGSRLEISSPGRAQKRQAVLLTSSDDQKMQILSTSSNKCLSFNAFKIQLFFNWFSKRPGIIYKWSSLTCFLFTVTIATVTDYALKYIHANTIVCNILACQVFEYKNIRKPVTVALVECKPPDKE